VKYLNKYYEDDWLIDKFNESTKHFRWIKCAPR
jgi:hypothetical protein